MMTPETIKKYMLNTARILFVAVIALLSAVVFFNPKPSETNILKAVLTDSKNDTILVDLSKRQSNRLNIIFESSDYEKLDSVYRTFFEQVDKNAFYGENADVTGMLDSYKKYSGGLLSYQTANLIQKRDYATVQQQAFERLYNPVGLTLLPLDKDPYLLLTDFVMSFNNAAGAQESEKDGKYYRIAQLNIKKELALSPTLLNEQMDKLTSLQQSLIKDNDNVNIYISGTPVHTYYASSKSMKEINIICLLSSLFIILLCKFYFNSFKILIPIAASLALAMYSGYLVTSVFFDSIHILTFVFASTLIGICVDYCLHYFAHNKDLKLIMPSLTQSLLTTVCAFLILLLSNIELLKQISTYTVTGLVTVYLTVVLLYPPLCRNLELPQMKKLQFFALPQKFKYIIAAIISVVAFAGVLNINFNDDIKDMYVPPKNLAIAEKLYAELSQKNFNPNFIITEAQDTQKLLEKEERTARLLQKYNIEYYALSRFVPSIKQQKENQQLIRELYNSTLKSYAQGFLDKQSINKLLNDNPRQEFLTPDNSGMAMLKEFLYNDGTSVMLVNGDIKDIKPALEKLDTGDKNGISLINLKDDISQKVGNCRKACLVLFLPAMIVLYLILAFIYRPVNAFKITLPSFLGAVFSIGVIGVTGGSLNLFHVLALFLIIGFTMDYSIFRFNGSSSSNSKSAVLISCATSVFSFFLLSMTSFKLISSLGFILCTGLLSSYILSLLLISKSADEHTQKQ